jgi:hypothetical protein
MFKLQGIYLLWVFNKNQPKILKLDKKTIFYYDEDTNYNEVYNPSISF